MIKKLSLLIASAVVVAIALPAFASAAPSVTMPANVLVPVGTEITGRSLNAKITTALGALVCGEVIVNGEIIKNNGTEVEAVGVGAGSTIACEIEGGETITITDLTTTNLTATGAVKKLEFSLEADLPGVTCHFVTPAGGLGFNYVAGTDTINIPEKKLTATPAACRPGEFSASFTIETKAGGAVILD